MRICFLSNGFGEDRAAALLAARLAADHPEVEVVGAPLLSDGGEFRRRGISVIATGWMPWSGGFSTMSATAFARDLPIVPHVIRFRRRLARHRHDIDAAVVVGDVFLLLVTRAALAVRPLFVALAKSNYHLPHSGVEHAILRRVPAVVIARDDHTRASLEAHGIRARYLGNLLMDDLVAPIQGARTQPAVVMLPGSRREAPANFAKMLDVIPRVRVPARWTCALAPSVPIAAVAAGSSASGWRLDGSRLVRGASSVELVEDGFARVIAAADVVLGLAGTANEQAAGLGRVVVSFPGTGTQAAPRRLRQQAALLGGAAIFEEGGTEAVAATVTRLLADPEERARRGRAGRERMGAPGAPAIAAFVANELHLPSRDVPR